MVPLTGDVMVGLDKVPASCGVPNEKGCKCLVYSQLANEKSNDTWGGCESNVLPYCYYTVGASELCDFLLGVEIKCGLLCGKNRPLRPLNTVEMMLYFIDYVAGYGKCFVGVTGKISGPKSTLGSD